MVALAMADADDTSAHEFASVRDISFTVGGETRLRKPGDMWVIPAGVPHAVERAGEAGCTIVETFSPPRDDWADKPRQEPSADRWPPS
jgi:uncharacterized RmlC-like cupin family protein